MWQELREMEGAWEHVRTIGERETWGSGAAPDSRSPKRLSMRLAKGRPPLPL